MEIFGIWYDGQWWCKPIVSEPGKGSDSLRALDLKCELDWTAHSMRGNFIYRKYFSSPSLTKGRREAQNFQKLVAALDKLLAAERLLPEPIRLILVPQPKKPRFPPWASSLCRNVSVSQNKEGLPPSTHSRQRSLKKYSSTSSYSPKPARLNSRRQTMSNTG
jgi:hypothetical protein